MDCLTLYDAQVGYEACKSALSRNASGLGFTDCGAFLRYAAVFSSSWFVSSFPLPSVLSRIAILHPGRLVGIPVCM